MKKLKSHLMLLCCILLIFCAQAWAADLPFGQVSTGTIVSGQTKTYTVSANANDILKFTVARTTGNFMPRIQVFNLDGTSLSDATHVYAVESNQVNIPVSGTYTVLVNDNNNTGYGDYAIYAQRTNNPSGAVPLPFGQVQTGAITAVSQSNSYTFNANADDSVFLYMVATSGNLHPKIYVFKPDGTTLVADSTGGSGLYLNQVKIPVSGIYTVLVEDYYSTGSGNYSVNAQRTNNPSGAEPLVFGQAKSGSIGTAGQINSYTISASASDTIFFSVARTSGSYGPKIYVFNPDGTLLTANSTSAVAMDLSQVKIPTNGTYTVLIADYNDTHTGTYAICAQRTINPTGVLPLPFGQAQTGAISSAAQINSYTFSANSNDSIYLYMVGTSGNSFGPKIYVFKPDGTTLAAISTPSTGVYLSQLQIPASGTYTVLVGDFNDFHTSNYSVYAQRINNPSGAVPIVFGQAQTGSISTAGQSNSYTIRVGANDSISLSMVSTSGSLRPKISIFNPDGTTLTANTTTGTSLSMNQVRIPASGTYTVLVGDYNDTRTGSYNLSTTCSGVCAIVPDAPVDASAVAGDSSAKVSFSAPLSNGGSEITSYTVTSIPGNVSVTGSVSPLTVSGLTNDTPYSFTVTATNRVGSGPASAPSNNVTPHASAAPVPAIGPWGVLTAAVGLGGLLRRRRIWK